MEFEELSNRVIGCAIEVHRVLGPGLLESVYAQCLAYELTGAGLRWEKERPVAVTYKEVQIDCGFRLDLIVDGCLIVEIKSIEKL